MPDTTYTPIDKDGDGWDDETPAEWQARKDREFAAFQAGQRIVPIVPITSVQVPVREIPSLLTVAPTVSSKPIIAVLPTKMQTIPVVTNKPTLNTASQISSVISKPVAPTTVRQSVASAPKPSPISSFWTKLKSWFKF